MGMPWNQLRQSERSVRANSRSHAPRDGPTGREGIRHVTEQAGAAFVRTISGRDGGSKELVLNGTA
jgi:hypothetical protein